MGNWAAGAKIGSALPPALLQPGDDKQGRERQAPVAPPTTETFDRPFGTTVKTINESDFYYSPSILFNGVI